MKRITPCPKSKLQRLYLTEGLSGPAIADRLGVGHTTVLRWMSTYGIQRREAGPKRVRRPPRRELSRMYSSERMSSVDIARKIGCSWVTVLRWMAEDGIALRSGSERARLVMSRRSYEERLRNSAASRAIFTGRRQSKEHRCRIALAKQKKAEASRYEADLLAAMRKAGLDPVLHFAIDKFNIDLALVEHRLAVEVDGGNWHRTACRKVAQDTRKREALTASGWTMLSVPTRRADWIDRALERVTAALR